MWLLAVLTGDRINGGLQFVRNLYGRFAGPKKSVRNIEVTVLPKGP